MEEGVVRAGFRCSMRVGVGFRRNLGVGLGFKWTMVDLPYKASLVADTSSDSSGENSSCSRGGRTAHSVASAATV